MKHVIDGPRPRGHARLKRFLRAERMTGAVARRQVQVLRRMPKHLNGGLRLKRYLGIARAES
ncbi:hypothetical protein [Ovoidimarina sediminis]|uniref:hypothetical protein n=1 Tax=Ovoidimarina sediminis TaxID=3079856 RepID=UPI002911C749|nr:hypothetical protein [Rhodophyticola sp. MJ-SS7]MDU8942360.1 hypothetical protein [Rhodophyticola sp. MJ-SS7]